MKALSLLLSLAAAALMSAQAADLTVSAAASLSDAFKDIGKAFTAQYPQDKVFFNFAGSGALLKQLQHGAPADVFASADQLRMDSAEAEGLINPGSRSTFAANSLVVILPAGSRAEVSDLTSLLSHPDIRRIAIANPDSVPAGTYSKQALEQAGLWEQLGDRRIPTQNVRQSLDYVARGEVDAGFVYASDALLMSDKVDSAFSVALDAAPSYAIAVTSHSASPEAAQRFVQFLHSEAAQSILRGYGFSAPSLAK